MDRRIPGMQEAPDALLGEVLRPAAAPGAAAAPALPDDLPPMPPGRPPCATSSTPPRR